MLFEDLPQNAIFACHLQGKSHYIIELKTPSENVGPKPLPIVFCFKWIIVWRKIEIGICSSIFVIVDGKGSV